MLRIIGFLFILLSVMVSFQSCEEIETQDTIKKKINGVPYTGLRPEAGTYYSTSTSTNSCNSGSLQNHSQIVVEESSTQAQVTNLCSGNTESVNFSDLFYSDDGQSLVGYGDEIYSTDQSYQSSLEAGVETFCISEEHHLDGASDNGLHLYVDYFDEQFGLDYYIGDAYLNEGESHYNAAPVTDRELIYNTQNQSLEVIEYTGANFTMSVYPQESRSNGLSGEIQLDLDGRSLTVELVCYFSQKQ